MNGRRNKMEISSENKDKLNEVVRNKFIEFSNKPPTLRELELELKLKIEQILKEEKERYELDKIAFESNPLHWSNNKRRLYGMNTLRGSFNKNRLKNFRSFNLANTIFYIIEDAIDKLLPQVIDGNLDKSISLNLIYPDKTKSFNIDYSAIFALQDKNWEYGRGSFLYITGKQPKNINYSELLNAYRENNKWFS